MTITAAQLAVNVTANTAEAEAGLNRVSEQSSGASGALGRMWETASGMIVAQVAMQALSFVTNQIKDVFTQANALQSVLTQTNTVLNSTHDAAGMSAQGISDLANQLSQVTPYSRTAVQSAENLLLTFTTVGKDTFPTATQAILDMSTAMGQDWKSSTIMVGKALDDPIKGLTALTRVGVTFTAEQKAQIKAMQDSGNMAGAQKVILTELEREFGNSAKAAGTTFSGQLQILNNSFDNVKAKIGMEIMPVLVQLVKAVAPAALAFGAALPGSLAAVGSALGQLKPVLGLAGEAFHYVFNEVAALMPQFRQFGQSLMTIGGPAQSVIASLFPVFKTLADVLFKQVIPAVLPLVAVWYRLQAAITSLIAPIIGTVLPILLQLAGSIIGTLAPALTVIITAIVTNVVPALRQLWNEIAPKLIPVLQFLANAIEHYVLPALVFIARVITTVVVPVLSFIIGVIGGVIVAVLSIGQVFTFIGGVVRAGIEIVRTIVDDGIKFIVGLFKWLYDHNTYFKDLVDAIRNVITLGVTWLKQTWQTVSKDIAAIWNTIVKDAKTAWTTFTNAISGVLKPITTAIGSIISAITSPIVDLAQTAITWGENLIKGFIQGITNMAGGIKKAAGNIVSSIGNFLGFHSPAKEGPGTEADTWAPNLMKMYADGLLSGGRAVSAAGHTVVSALTEALNPAANGRLSATVTHLAGPIPNALAASTMGAQAAASAMSQQQIILEVDGRRLGTVLMPILFGNNGLVRQATGVRSI